MFFKTSNDESPSVRDHVSDFFFSEGMDSDAAMTAIGKSEGLCGKLQVCREKKDNYEEGCINGEES